MATKKNEDPLVGSDETSTPKARASRAKKVPGDTGSVKASSTTEEKVEAVAKQARKTARKVASAVTELVSEIAEKVGRKASTGVKRATAATTKATTTKVTGTAKKPTVSRATKDSALVAGTNDKDIRETLAGLSSSEFMPDEATIADEAATDVKQHFFHDQHIHPGPPPPQAPRDLPDEYGDTKLVLLVRDPEWVYAYWEFNEDTRRQFQLPANGDQRNLVLRMFKISGRNWPDEPAHYFFDVEVSADTRSWYLHLPEANESWCAEIGIFDQESNFVAVCRSNSFYTPRNSISDHQDSEWMTVEESFEKITRLSGGDMEVRLRGDTTFASETLLKTIQRQLTGVLHGERSAMSSGIFSSESALPVAGKDFWLQVNTELILYGATEPDARVTVQGKPIALNADGTFSIRYTLPDGEQTLEVKAVKSTGDMEETITPVVQRTTR